MTRADVGQIARGLAATCALTLLPASTQGQECPADTQVEYVGAKETIAAAFYFPWHDSTPGTCESNPMGHWCACVFPSPTLRPTQAKQGNPKPELGFYDSGEDAAVDQHLAWMRANGVDVVAIEFTGKTDDGILDNMIAKVLPRLAPNGLKWVILYDRFIGRSLVDLDEPGTRDQVIKDFENFATTPDQFFKHPQYLTMDGRPVVYLYISRSYTSRESTPTLPAGCPGNTNCTEWTFEQVRSKVRGAGYDDLYLVGDELYFNWDSNLSAKKLKMTRMGLRAVSAFAPVEPGRGITNTQVDPPMRAWADVLFEFYATAKHRLVDPQLLIDINPGIFVQYDDRSVASPCPGARQSTQVYNLRSGADWTYMVDRNLHHRWVAERTEVRPPPSCDTIVTSNTSAKSSILWIYSFNEWAEGSGMEPVREQAAPTETKYPYGFGTDVLTRLHNSLFQFVDPPGPTCQEAGFFPAEALGACDDSCKAECQKKEWCVSLTNPDFAGFCHPQPPSYCWKCPDPDPPPPGDTCADMGWYDAHESTDCTNSCSGSCVRKTWCADGLCQPWPNYCWKCDAPEPPPCGNGTCGPGEDWNNCALDCDPPAGSTCESAGFFDSDEHNECDASCNYDCKKKTLCNGQLCQPWPNYCWKCPTGSGGSSCGNGDCETGETASSCPSDCGSGQLDCDDMGWFFGDELSQCNSSCSTTCQKKQSCGGVPCASGYCWKCP